MITEGKYARDQTSHIVTSWSDQIHGQRFFAAKKNPKAPNMTKWRRATLASTGRLQRQGFSVGLKFGYRILYSMEIDKFDKIDHVWSCKGKTFLWKLLVVIEKSYTSASTHSLPGLQISCKSELPKAARPDTQTIHGVSRRNCWEPAAKKRSAFPVTVHTESIFNAHRSSLPSWRHPKKLFVSWSILHFKKHQNCRNVTRYIFLGIKPRASSVGLR